MSNPLLNLFGVGREAVTSAMATDSALRTRGLGIEGGALLPDLSVDTSESTHAHGLGRPPQGAIIVKANDAVSVVMTGGDARSVTLLSSGAATVSVVVF